MALTLLVDAYSLAFRAYFALPENLETEGGQPTNALHGFSNMLATLLQSYQPDRVVVAFDAKGKTFRDDLYADYKGHRPPVPLKLQSQFPLLRELLDALSIAWIEAAGFEADDVIATLATGAAEQGDTVYIVTGDRDSFQLVRDPDITVLYNKRGVSEVDFMDEAAVLSKVGVPAALYPHLASLRGDPSDNIIGVSGVGEKTAAKLINDYGSIDEVLLHLDSLSPKLKESISQASERVRENLKLSLLVRDVPIETDLEKFNLAEWDSAQAREVLYSFGLRRAYDRFRTAFSRRIDVAGAQSSEKAAVDLPVVEVDSFQFSQRLSSSDFLYVQAHWANEPGRSPLLGLAMAVVKESGTLLVGTFEHTGSEWMEVLQTIGQKKLFGVNLKPLARSILDLGVKIELSSISGDISIADYLLEPSSGRYALLDLSHKWLGIELVADTTTTLFTGPTLEKFFEAAKSELAIIFLLVDLLEKELKKAGMYELYRDVEIPLAGVLAEMEHLGIAVDVRSLERLSAWISEQTKYLLAEMQKMIGRSFNPNSTQQLAQVLFSDLGLTPQKRTKTGFSTDAQTLERLKDDHPFVGTLLRYREFEKLRSTYGDSLLAEVADDGRIHATFQQTVARTGRLSSDHPNLHNIPIRTEEGRRFRDVFVAPKGSKLVVADYNQIELRIIAHLSHDSGLVEAFRAGKDVHTATASMVFAVPEEEVTYEQRTAAKMVAYGLAYGMEAYGLAQRLGIGNKEAELILDSFFSALPQVKGYMEETIKRTREVGYTTTEFGRRRYLPELASSDARVRQAAERQAMNAGIQGLAADIFKKALVNLAQLVREDKSIRIVLQVHDEIVVEAIDSEVPRARELLEKTMSGAAKLRVPLSVSVSVGQNWGDAKH